jgi:hypothetical protein
MRTSMNVNDSLPSWREGAAKTALLNLIGSVTEPCREITVEAFEQLAADA